MLRRASQMWVKRAQTAAFKSWNVNVKEKLEIEYY